MKGKVEKMPHEIQPNRTDVVRLVQVTDSHIFADAQGCLLGLNTRDSFQSVCERVSREEWKPDALLATGDLSQDASSESYQYLAEYFKSMDIPTFWLPGNHDKPDVMAKYLTNSKVFSAKQLLLGNWQVILLDSSVKEKVYGNLSEEELAFLKTSLSRYPDKNALICLHHQPLKVGSDWLDKIGLKNNQEFRQLLDQFPQVKGVIWGHVHQESQQVINGVQWLATPSSCVQFMPDSKDFSAGTEAPGYRYLNLYSDGRIESIVHRIDNLEFTVDYSIKGY
jgi:3',5'-cyclic-AMP phosphodiesterase